MTFYLVFIPTAALLISAPFVMLWHLWWLGRGTYTGQLIVIRNNTGTEVTWWGIKHVYVYNWQRFYP